MIVVRQARVARLLQHVRPLLLGHPLHGKERYRPFSIVGSGRCGTTLLRSMLEAHPDVHIPPGSVMLGAMIREYKRYARLPWSALLRTVLGQLALHPTWEAFDLSMGAVFRELVERPPRARHLAAVFDAVHRGHMMRHKPSASRWGDKRPFGVLALRDWRKVFPDVRVIHILRDGRDVAASFVDAFGEDVSRAAMVWLRAIRAAHAFRARWPGQFLEIRYEDLVSRPEETIRRVTVFLSLEFDAQMLRHQELNLRLGDVERTPYMQGVKRAIHQSSVGRWRTAFDAAQVAELARLLNPTLDRLGYPVN